MCAKKLHKHSITLSTLLLPKLTFEQTVSLIKKLDLRVGVELLFNASIAQIREDISNSNSKALEIANEVKLKEQELAKQKNALKQEELRVESTSTKTKDVFLSYCWANKPTVRKLHDILKEKGFDCWIDDNVMQGGSHLFSEIDNGITNCKVFIACCSDSYGASVNCQREILLATDRNKLIIPTLVALTSIWPPKGQMAPLLTGKLYMDISTDEKFIKTVDQLVITINQTLL